MEITLAPSGRLYVEAFVSGPEESGHHRVWIHGWNEHGEALGLTQAGQLVRVEEVFRGVFPYHRFELMSVCRAVTPFNADDGDPDACTAEVENSPMQPRTRPETAQAGQQELAGS